MINITKKCQYIELKIKLIPESASKEEWNKTMQLIELYHIAVFRNVTMEKKCKIW